MIGVDTLTWGKLLMMSDKFSDNSIRNLLDKFRLFITPQVEEELIYYHKDMDWLWSGVAILPAMNAKYKQYAIQNFDDADISLLEYSELPGYAVITEDKPMLALNISSQNNIIQLADFFLICLEEQLIEPGQFRQYLKWLRSKKNIPKKKYKRLQI